MVKSYSEKEANKIRDEFQGLAEKLNDDEFWGHARTWLFRGSIMDLMSNWNLTSKKESIKEFKEILAKRKPEKKPNCRDCAHLKDYGKDNGMHCDMRIKPKENCKRFKKEG